MTSNQGTLGTAPAPLRLLSRWSLELAAVAAVLLACFLPRVLPRDVRAAPSEKPLVVFADTDTSAPTSSVGSSGPGTSGSQPLFAAVHLKEFDAVQRQLETVLAHLRPLVLFVSARRDALLDAKAYVDDAVGRGLFDADAKEAWGRLAREDCPREAPIIGPKPDPFALSYEKPKPRTHLDRLADLASAIDAIPPLVELLRHVDADTEALVAALDKAGAGALLTEPCLRGGFHPVPFPTHAWDPVKKKQPRTAAVSDALGDGDPQRLEAALKCLRKPAVTFASIFGSKEPADLFAVPELSFRRGDDGVWHERRLASETVTKLRDQGPALVAATRLVVNAVEVVYANSQPTADGPSAANNPDSRPAAASLGMGALLEEARLLEEACARELAPSPSQARGYDAIRRALQELVWVVFATEEERLYVRRGWSKKKDLWGRLRAAERSVPSFGASLRDRVGEKLAGSWPPDLPPEVALLLEK